MKTDQNAAALELIDAAQNDVRELSEAFNHRLPREVEERAIAALRALSELRKAITPASVLPF